MGTCRVCGCTENQACYSHNHGTCWWVEPDLCSHCAEPVIVAELFDTLGEDGGTLEEWTLWTKRARTALERAASADPQVFEV